MAYYHKKQIEGSSFQEALRQVKTALKKEGFGILTEIDMKAVMQEKLQHTIKPYHILGACNPPFASKALQVENKIGTLLPCNVIVQELEPGTYEIAVVDPVVSMQAVAKQDLEAIADEVNQKLQQVLDSL